MDYMHDFLTESQTVSSVVDLSETSADGTVFFPVRPSMIF